MLAQFDAQNGAALEELITKHHVELIRFPDEVLEGLAEGMAAEVAEEEAAKDPLSQRKCQRSVSRRFRESGRHTGEVRKKRITTPSSRNTR